jgi:hypothetical protein
VKRLLSLCVLLVACNNGPLMTPGEDCHGCHGDFTVSGTVFKSPDALPQFGLGGASVLVDDAAGRSLSLTTNSAGNFYTREDLTFPLTVSVQLGENVRRMAPLVDQPGCNNCHDVPPIGSATGRIFITP